MFGKLWSENTLLLVMLVLFLVTAVAIAGLIPTIIGNFTFGIFAGTAIGKIFIENTRTEIREREVEKIVPYEQWPEQCYSCGDEIPESMEYRGQYVVHKGEDAAKTKAVGLCEECTWTYSTLVDNHERFIDPLDCRNDPIEL